MRIPRLTDRFIVKLGEISVEVSPLSGREKVELAGFTTFNKGIRVVDRPSQEHYIVKHSVKKLFGVKNYSGSDYELTFEGSVLSDDCADEVLSMLASGWFTVALGQLAGNEDGKVINPIDGKPLDGVFIEYINQSKDEESEAVKK